MQQHTIQCEGEAMPITGHIPERLKGVCMSLHVFLVLRKLSVTDNFCF